MTQPLTIRAPCPATRQISQDNCARKSRAIEVLMVINRRFKDEQPAATQQDRSPDCGTKGSLANTENPEEEKTASKIK